ncbi:tetratricopeptide repeat protein [Candidatus Manganitrophus noduliformans]|uniref:Tetratricopeptide repeat protein n=1 Tax=Candidatus Manganitrophus noduliformans TaxID=2606439 RepID=A0A7X6ICU0_9BACT|nr:tetratricopeptide repeat protein [Candidatus Manganitrophus noduliformans]NKE73043.1 tetratricopeptide repeat protein [Candidatus Manganitrophus noduliformans]
MKRVVFTILLLNLIVLAPDIRAEDRDLPLFPENHSAEGADPFKTILQAYQEGQFALAVSETDRLLQQFPKGPLAETASFLRGDLHLKWAETGGSDHLHDALAAFKEAQLMHPDTENAVRSLWRMGQVYEKLGFYYESIGNFKRILLRHPNSRFALLARIGIAETYRGWEKWKEAADAYEQIDLRALSQEDQRSVLLGHADSLYQQGDFKTAHRKYERGEALAGDSRKPVSPIVLFQHAESAYRTGRAGQARNLFSNLFNIFPTHPLASIALARTGDTWRREGRFDEAGFIYAQIQSAPAADLNAGLDKLMASIGQLAMRECASAAEQKRPSHCQGENREEIRRALELLENQVKTVLQAAPRDGFAQEILLEGIEQFRIYGSHAVALELQSRFLTLLPSSLFRLRLAALHRKTIGEEVGRLAKEEDHLKIVSLFHALSSNFTPPMLTGPTGLQVGKSHARLGLHTQAIDLYAPIAASLSSRLAEEALFLLGKSLLEKGDYAQAEHKMNTFLKRYPKSRHLSALLIDLGAALDHQGKHPRAIKIYAEWLLKNPKHADQEKVSLLLAKAFRKKGDYRKEAAIYLKWIDHRPENAAELSFPLGDAYYRLREYQKAIQAYRTALKEKSETPEGDWIQLQIAKSYAALGQKTRGRSLFDQLARNAKDPLVRQMAAEAMATLNLRSFIDGNRRKEG